MANEIAAVSEILRSSQWNMTYGRGLVHERLEAEFAEAVGARQARALFLSAEILRADRALAIVPDLGLASSLRGDLLKEQIAGQ